MKTKKDPREGEVVGQVSFRRSLGMALRQHVAEGHIGDKDEAFEISLCLGSGSLRVHFSGAKSGTTEGGRVQFEGQYFVAVEDLVKCAWVAELKRREGKL